MLALSSFTHTNTVTATVRWSELMNGSLTSLNARHICNRELPLHRATAARRDTSRRLITRPVPTQRLLSDGENCIGDVVSICGNVFLNVSIKHRPCSMRATCVVKIRVMIAALTANNLIVHAKKIDHPLRAHHNGALSPGWC